MLFTEALDKAKKTNTMLKCDNCERKFKEKDAILSDVRTNVRFLTPLSPFVYIDTKGHLISSSTQPSNGDKVVTCPLCNAQHLFGFSIAGPED